MKRLQKQDFGVLYGAERAFEPASSITALWQDAEKRAMEQLYASTLGAKEPITSDYERFRALCRLMPCLKGSAVRRHCEDLLADRFQIESPMNEETCDAIWHATAEALLLSPCSVADVVGDGRRCLLAKESDLDGWDASRISVVLDANGLPRLEARDWKEWLACANARIERFGEAGCDRAFFTIPRGYTFEAPNLYRVGEVLLSKRRDATEEYLLITQALRYLCERCREKGWSLYLRAEGAAEETLRLLEYVSKAVGLPSVCFMTPCPDVRDALLAFGASQVREESFLPLVCLADHPSEGELRRAIEEYAARFPIGLLQFACGGDLRNARSEEARLCRVLSEFENQ